MSEGQTLTLVLALNGNEPAVFPPLGETAGLIDETNAYWKEWSQCIAYKGPHRDDVRLSVDERSVQRFCSQGEQKSVLFALKSAECRYLADQRGESPIMLVDDLPAMFDSEHAITALRTLITRGQVIATAADTDRMLAIVRLAGVADSDHRLFTVVAGQVQTITECRD